MNLGRRLAWARKHIKVTQVILSQLSGIGQSTITGIEANNRESSKYAAQLAKALDLNLEWLVDGTGQPWGNPNTTADRELTPEMKKLEPETWAILTQMAKQLNLLESTHNKDDNNGKN